MFDKFCDAIDQIEHRRRVSWVSYGMNPLQALFFKAERSFSVTIERFSFDHTLAVLSANRSR